MHQRFAESTGLCPWLQLFDSNMPQSWLRLYTRAKALYTFRNLDLVQKNLQVKTYFSEEQAVGDVMQFMTSCQS